MAAPKVFACIVVLGITFSMAYATDPTQLQDFCVTDDPRDWRHLTGAEGTGNDSKVTSFINGYYCKNPLDTTADDFLFRGLDKAVNINEEFGFGAIVVSSFNLSGINTLGVSVGRVDLAPDGVVPPHSHARASEVFIVMEGTIYVGFVNYQNKLFSKVLNKGDVFVFPQALLHFHHNVGKTAAYAITAFSSQDPGILYYPNALFGSQPSISADTLAKSFKLKTKVVKNLQSKFTPRPN